MIIMRIIIGIYAALALLTAVPSLIKEEDRLFIIHIVMSLIAIIAAFITKWPVFMTIAIIMILTYQILAVMRGVKSGFFHWYRHAIRALISVILIVLLLIF